jgi:hypothetical protein
MESFRSHLDEGMQRMTDEVKMRLGFADARLSQRGNV